MDYLPNDQEQEEDDEEEEQEEEDDEEKCVEENDDENKGKETEKEAGTDFKTDVKEKKHSKEERNRERGRERGSVRDEEKSSQLPPDSKYIHNLLERNSKATLDLKIDKNSESDSDDENENENLNENKRNNFEFAENDFIGRSENSEEFSNYSEGKTLDLESYEENLELDILNNSDVDSYFAEYRKRVDGVLTDFLQDLKTRKPVEKSVNRKLSSGFTSKKKLSPLVSKKIKKNEIKSEKHEEIAERNQTSLIRKREKDEKKESIKNLDLKIFNFENISNVSVICEKILKNKSIFLFLIFAAITHHTIIFGLMK